MYKTNTKNKCIWNFSRIWWIF